MGRKRNDVLRGVITDCMTQKLTEREALGVTREDGTHIPGFIEMRYGKSISRRFYYKLRDELKSDPHIREYLTNYTNIGFVIKHKEREDEMLKLQEDLWRDYHALRVENPEHPDDMKIWTCMRQMISVNKRLAEISLGTPIVSQIKAQLDQTGGGIAGQTGTGISNDLDSEQRSNRIF
jgi:hypothetical protein